MKAAVLYGKVLAGAGRDEEDAYAQAAAVSEALSRLGHDAEILALTLDIGDDIGDITKLKPDYAFNLLDAIEGRGNMAHLSALILDDLNIPYTGSPAEALFLTSHKITAKRILKACGIATPEWFSGHGTGPETIAAPYIVKSVWEHASAGLDEDAVCLPGNAGQPGLRIAALQKRLNGPCFAEVFIEGREISVSLLEMGGKPKLLPPAEILFAQYPPHKAKFLGYRSKWMEDSFEYAHTPRTFEFSKGDQALLADIREIALHCWQVFNLRGYARVDFRVDKTGKPWVLEINANPCLSPDSGFIAAAKQDGIDYEGVIEEIIRGVTGARRSG